MLREDQYALDIIHVIKQLFDEESENYRYKDVDATEFFTGFILAFSAIYQTWSKEKVSLIDSVGIANKLVTQFLIKNGKLIEGVAIK